MMVPDDACGAGYVRSAFVAINNNSRSKTDDWCLIKSCDFSAHVGMKNSCGESVGNTRSKEAPVGTDCF